MGFCHEEHDGVSAETRRESFYIHANSLDVSPEFLYSEVGGLIDALNDVKRSDRYLSWLRVHAEKVRRGES